MVHEQYFIIWVPSPSYLVLYLQSSAIKHPLKPIFLFSHRVVVRMLFCSTTPSSTTCSTETSALHQRRCTKWRVLQASTMLSWGCPMAMTPRLGSEASSCQVCCYCDWLLFKYGLCTSKRKAVCFLYIAGWCAKTNVSHYLRLVAEFNFIITIQ